MDSNTKELLMNWAAVYNDPVHFLEDPIAFPREFVARGACLQDIEIAAIFASHLAWGRRSMIVRDCTRLFDEMQWRPYEYVMNGDYRDGNDSLHRTVKWSEVSGICLRLKEWYSRNVSLESMDTSQMRREIFGQKDDPHAANKKINMMRRWMVRDDGKVDLGVWKNIDKRELLVPLDVHVHAQATALGLCTRKQKDYKSVCEITGHFHEVWPDDPLLGDFALFGYGVTGGKDA